MRYSTVDYSIKPHWSTASQKNVAATKPGSTSVTNPKGSSTAKSSSKKVIITILLRNLIVVSIVFVCPKKNFSKKYHIYE